MPKWLTAIFALFLSIQVFGARGKAVDKFLGSCFSPDTVGRVQHQVPHRSTEHHRINPVRRKRQATVNIDFLKPWQALISNEVPDINHTESKH